MRTLAPLFALAAVVIAACGSTAADAPDAGVVGDEPATTPPTKGARDGGSTFDASNPPDTCDRKFITLDPSTLTPCENGQGHCYDKNKTPRVGTLPECNPAQWCVPNNVFAAGGQPLPLCDSGYGDGACVSPLVEEVADGASSLSHDGCDADTYCVPCVHPETRVFNPACGAIGVYDVACNGLVDDGGPPQIVVDAGPVELSSCCVYEYSKYGGQDYDAGKCVPNDALSDSQKAANFPQNTCHDNFTCAPKILVDGGNLTACHWDEGFFGDDGPGLCVDACFIPPENYEDLDSIYDGGCGGTEYCVPCYKLPQGTPGCY